jgi:hypothetical protein
MAVVEIAKIQVRRGQESAGGMPQLSPGEFGWAEDTQNLYIGKSITEGAVDNNNTRILTELDIAGLTGGGGGSLSSVQYFTVQPGANSVKAVDLKGSNQTLIFAYTLNNDSTFTRNGTLTLIISADGYASVADEYSYSELVPDSSTLVTFSTDLTNSPYTGAGGNYITLTCNNTDTNPYVFEYTINTIK